MSVRVEDDEDVGEVLEEIYRVAACDGDIDCLDRLFPELRAA